MNKSEIETIEMITIEKNFLIKLVSNFMSGDELKKFNPEDFIPQIATIVSMSLIDVLNKTKYYLYENKPNKEDKERWKNHMDYYISDLRWKLRSNLSNLFGFSYTMQEKFNYCYNGKTIFEILADFYENNSRVLSSEDKMFEDIVEIITINVVAGLLQIKELKKQEDIKKEEEKKKMEERAISEKYEAIMERERERIANEEKYENFCIEMKKKFVDFYAYKIGIPLRAFHWYCYTAKDYEALYPDAKRD